MAGSVKDINKTVSRSTNIVMFRPVLLSIRDVDFAVDTGNTERGEASRQIGILKSSGVDHRFEALVEHIDGSMAKVCGVQRRTTARPIGQR